MGVVVSVIMKMIKESKLIIQKKKQIADFYQTIKRGPISVISFKEILNLAKKVKLDYKSNNNLLLEIKQFFYQQNMNIVKEQMISKKKSKHTSI